MKLVVKVDGVKPQSMLMMVKRQDLYRRRNNALRTATNSNEPPVPWDCFTSGLVANKWKCLVCESNQNPEAVKECICCGAARPGPSPTIDQSDQAAASIKVENSVEIENSVEMEASVDQNPKKFTFGWPNPTTDQAAVKSNLSSAIGSTNQDAESDRTQTNETPVVATFNPSKFVLRLQLNFN